MTVKNYKLEICLDSVESAIAAELGGADRVELCDNLFEGGTTPSAGAIRVAREKISIGLQVMIRPRGGDFCYTDIEFEVMKADILTAKEAGADGVVFGILLPDGNIDIVRSHALVELARPLNVTFHRAYDMTPDPYRALEDVISTGADRLLTSGQEKSVIEGIPLVKELIKKAAGRIIILPGAGITERNRQFFLEATGATEIHLAVNNLEQSKMTYRPDHIFMGGYLHLPEFGISRTDGTAIARMTGRKSGE